jgi:sodium/potassium-transporting ATPase subunit alpha
VAADRPRLPLPRIAAELAVILFILYTPAGNWLFGTAAIGGGSWLLAAGCAILMCALEELRKAWLRRGERS